MKFNKKLLFLSNKKPRKKTLYYSWTLSYLIVLLLPLLLSFIVYIQAYATIKSEVNSSQQASLTKLKTDFDNEFIILGDFVSKVSLNTDISFLLNAPDISVFSSSVNNALKISAMSTALSLYEPSYSFISDYYIFSEQNGLVLHNQGINEISSYQKLNSNYSGIIIERCQGLDMSQNQIFTITNDAAARSYTAVTYPIPNTYIPSGYIVILLDNEQLSGSLHQISELNSSNMYLCDDSFHILSSSANITDAEIFTNLGLAPNMQSTALIEQENTYIFTTPSNVLQIHYVCALPEAIASAKLIYLRNYITISLICCLAGGGLLIILLAKHNYSPLEKLILTIQAHSDDSAENSLNEYQYVTNAINKIYSEHKSIAQVVQRQNKTIYSYYLGRLLKGDISILDMDEHFINDMETHVLLSNYIVLMSVTDVSTTWNAEHDAFMESTWLAFFEVQICQKLQELLGLNCNITNTVVDGFSTCIIGFNDALAEDWQTQIKSAIRQISENLNNHDFQCRFSTSLMHTDITDLTTAGQEAFASLSYAIMNKNVLIVYFEDVKTTDLSRYHYPSNSEQQLIYLIQSGQKEPAVTLVNMLMDELAGTNISFENAKCAVCDIMCSVIKAKNQFSSDSFSALSNDLNRYVDRLIHANSFDKLRHILLEATRKICTAIQSAAESTNENTWVPKIDQVIDTYLYDENLNIMFIANQLGMNSKYLSALYQDAKRSSIIDTIHKKRIRQFKHLIMDEDMKINDAAAAVGYTNTATLNRWFKKYEGITPGQLKTLG